MKYEDYINNILNSRGRFNCSGYKERHHIIPKSLGGSNDKSNLIDLYPQEHFIAHKLLFEENPNNNKLGTAYFRMCFYNGKPGIQITPEEYAEARLAYSNLRKITQVGAGNPFYGHTHSEETKQKISRTKKEQSKDPEYIKKLSESHKGLVPSPEIASKRVDKLRGIPRPQQVKDKIKNTKIKNHSGNNCKGKVKITDGTIKKFVFPQDADEWLEKGFSFATKNGFNKYIEAKSSNVRIN